MRELHMDSVERWAEYIKTNPGWRKIHNQFIDAQYEKAYAFLDRLAKTPGGKEKIIKLYGIKNTNAYPRLLGNL